MRDKIKITLRHEIYNGILVYSISYLIDKLVINWVILWNQTIFINKFQKIMISLQKKLKVGSFYQIGLKWGYKS